MSCVVAGRQEINTVYLSALTAPNSSNSVSGVKVTASWLQGSGVSVAGRRMWWAGLYSTLSLFPLADFSQSRDKASINHKCFWQSALAMSDKIRFPCKQHRILMQRTAAVWGNAGLSAFCCIRCVAVWIRAGSSAGYCGETFQGMAHNIKITSGRFL